MNAAICKQFSENKFKFGTKIVTRTKNFTMVPYFEKIAKKL